MYNQNGVLLKFSTYSRIIEEAKYILEHRCTIRQCAKVFGVSKSTIWNDMAHKLNIIDIDLYTAVNEVFQYNLSQRAKRGAAGYIAYLRSKSSISGNNA